MQSYLYFLQEGGFLVLRFSTDYFNVLTAFHLLIFICFLMVRPAFAGRQVQCLFNHFRADNYR
jgi:hypothetical protein